MFTHQKTITPEIRQAILCGSSHATSKEEVKRAIFTALVDAGVDWRIVSVDEVKEVLVDALRVARRQTHACDNTLAA